LKIMLQRNIDTMSLIALDCNWTADSEKNYFNVWAAVSFHQRKDRLFLHGARFCNWSLEYEMEPVITVDNMNLYRLSLNKPSEFPNEFVLRLDRETGEQIYDNNDYRNYSIEHDQGHFVSAILQSTGIFSFETIIPVKIISC